MDITTLYSLFLKSTGVTTDSRNCPQGSIFIALKGDTFNGNAFAYAALEKGCSYVVVDDGSFAIAGDNRYIVVDNGLKTLQRLASYHRRELGTPVIGITGTNGKTTTKELIAAVLSQKYNILYTEGNLNNHIGVPLTLLRLTKEHEMAIVEMGASRPGDIKELVDIAVPNFGIITNIGKGHLLGFGSFEKIMETKGELYDFLRANKYSGVFVNADDKILAGMSVGMNIISYGTQGRFINGKIMNNSLYLSFGWQHAKEGPVHIVNTRLIGSYNFPNALAAVAVGYYFDVKAENIDRAISNYIPANNRSQLMKTARNTLIIDAYNANPTSMMASLENFNNMEAEHKTVILGDMLELGADSMAEHQKIIDYIKSSNIEEVILVGDFFSSLNHTYKSYKVVGDLIEALKEEKPIDKTILIKGSNCIKLRLLPEYL